MKKKLIIYGIGKFTDYISYLFSNESDFEIVTYCLEDNYLSKLKKEELNKPIVSLEEVMEKFPPDDHYFFVAVGNDQVRERIFNECKKKKYRFASFISSKSVLYPDISLGENIFISEDTAIQPFVKILDNSMLIGARVGHHSVIGKNTLISLSSIGANCIIGDNSFLGINSAIMPNIIIGKKNIIGMGCTITKNTSDLEVYSNSTTKKRSLNYNDIAGKYL